MTTLLGQTVGQKIQALLLINLYQDTGIKIYAACYVLISRATECCAVQILNCTKPLWNNSLDDIKKLDEAKIPAVVIGKAIYEQQINLEELAQTFIQ